MDRTNRPGHLTAPPPAPGTYPLRVSVLVWVTLPTNSGPCKACSPLHALVLPDNTEDLPPLHQRCRCRVTFETIVVESPTQLLALATRLRRNAATLQRSVSMLIGPAPVGPRPGGHGRAPPRTADARSQTAES